MYPVLAILAAIVLLYGTVSARLERTPFSGALIFLGVGILLGPVGFGVLELSVDTGELRLLAELTLALVLFVEAADANLDVLQENFRIPVRLLAIGLPLCIALGFALVVPLFPDLPLLEVADLAVVVPGAEGPHPQLRPGVESGRFELAPSAELAKPDQGWWVEF